MHTPSIILASALIFIPQGPVHAQAAAANAGHAVTARAVVRRPTAPLQAQQPVEPQDADHTDAVYATPPADVGGAFPGAGCPFLESVP